MRDFALILAFLATLALGFALGLKACEPRWKDALTNSPEPKINPETGLGLSGPYIAMTHRDDMLPVVFVKSSTKRYWFILGSNLRVLPKSYTHIHGLTRSTYDPQYYKVETKHGRKL